MESQRWTYNNGVIMYCVFFFFFLQYKFLLLSIDSALAIPALHSKQRKWRIFSTVLLGIKCYSLFQTIHFHIIHR